MSARPALPADLARQAVIGIANADYEIPPPFQALVAQLPAAPGATGFARLAGVVAAHHLAAIPLGQHPPAIAGAIPHAPVLPGDHPLTPTLAAVLAARGNNVVNNRIQIEALRSLGPWLLPVELLAKGIQAGERYQAARRPLRRALGLRGAWVAEQAGARWVAATNLGPEGGLPPTDLDERVLYLQLKRRDDPAGALGELITSWPELDSTESAALLPPLETNLGPADQEFLTGILSSRRSPAVKHLAAQLLARIPHAPLGEALWFWFTQAVTQSSDGGWRLDGFEDGIPGWEEARLPTVDRRSQPIRGQTAWWVALFELVPLAWWNHRTGLTPGQLMLWQEQWSKLNLPSIWRHLARLEDRDWLDALVSVKDADIIALIDGLPAETREHFWPGSAADFIDHARRIEILDLYRVGESLSQQFSLEVIAALHLAMQRAEGIDPDLMALLHPATLPGLKFEPMPEATPAVLRTVENANEILAMRARCFQNPSDQERK